MPAASAAWKRFLDHTDISSIPGEIPTRPAGFDAICKRPQPSGQLTDCYTCLNHRLIHENHVANLRIASHHQLGLILSDDNRLQSIPTPILEEINVPNGILGNPVFGKLARLGAERYGFQASDPIYNLGPDVVNILILLDLAAKADDQLRSGASKKVGALDVCRIGSEFSGDCQSGR